MSISSELLTLQNTKTAIRNSINAKGGSVGASDTFASYATAIDNLPSGGSGNPLLTSIDVSDFTGTTFNKVASYITDVTIPSGVTSITDNAFQDATRLTSIEFPSSLTNIGSRAFQGAGISTTITIPSNVTLVNSYAFADIQNIPSAILEPTTPPVIGNYAFFGSYPIYVPFDSVDTYKAASGWSTYASRIFAIQQVATVDGNPVYNYEIGVTDISSTLTDLQVTALPSGDVLEFAEGVTGIQGQIGGYEEVILPSTFTSFADTQPINAATTTLTCKATTPPVVERNNLGGSGLTEIYVPAASVDTYKVDTAWSSFVSIIQAIPVQEHALFAPPPQTATITEDPDDDLWWLTFPLKIYYSDGTEMTDTYYRINSQGQGVARQWTPSLTGILDDPNGDLADVVPDGGQFTPVYDSTNGWTMKYEFSLCLNDPSDPSPLVGQTVTFSTPIGGMQLPADYAEVDGTWVQVRDQENRSGSFTVTITGIERS